MAVKIRMMRIGRRHRPFFRINAIESRNQQKGRILEKLGHYDPIEKDKDKQVVLNLERVKHWLDIGAVPTDAVSQILLRHGIKTKHYEATIQRRQRAKAIARAAGKPFTQAERATAAKAEAEAPAETTQPAAPVEAEEAEAETTEPAEDVKAEEGKAETPETTESVKAEEISEEAKADEAKAEADASAETTQPAAPVEAEEAKAETTEPAEDVKADEGDKVEAQATETKMTDEATESDKADETSKTDEADEAKAES